MLIYTLMCICVVSFTKLSMEKKYFLLAWIANLERILNLKRPYFLPLEFHADLEKHRLPPIILMVIPGHLFFLEKKNYSGMGKHIAGAMGVGKGPECIKQP